MKRILLCTDGSNYSEVCSEFASWLASRAKADVDALYVTDLRQYEMPMLADFSGSLGAQPYQNLVSQLQEIEKLKRDSIEEGVQGVFRQESFQGEFNFIYREGTLVEQVEKLEGDYDIVMLGKRGMGAETAAEHLGSSMERVVRASNKPVLVTSRAFRPISTVVLAYDGGRSSKKALDFLCNDPVFKDLQLHVVSVEEKGCDAAAKLKEARDRLQAAGYSTVQGEVLKGEADDVIAEYTERHHADLLIIGAYGHGRLRTLFVGSTTTELLRTRNLPLLCFR